MEIDFNPYDLGFSFDTGRDIYYGDVRCNFGVQDFAGGEAGGHDSFAHILVPNRPELFLIGHFDETEIEQDVFCSSKENWFPHFVMWCLHEGWFYEDQMKPHLDKLKAMFRDHNIEGLEPYIDPLFDAVANDNVRDWMEENYYPVLSIIGKGTFIGDYADLKNSGTREISDWAEYLLKYDFVNLGFEELIEDEDDEERLAQIPTDLTYELLTRNLSRNLDSCGQADLKEICAKHCYEAYKDSDSPMAALIRFLVDQGEDVPEYELYFRAGQKFEAEGDLQRALNCYENAVIVCNADYEDAYIDGLNAIFELAPKFGDEAYSNYVKWFRENSDAGL